MVATIGIKVASSIYIPVVKPQDGVLPVEIHIETESLNKYNLTTHITSGRPGLQNYYNIT